MAAIDSSSTSAITCVGGQAGGDLRLGGCRQPMEAKWSSSSGRAMCELTGRMRSIGSSDGVRDTAGDRGVTSTMRAECTLDDRCIDRATRVGSGSAGELLRSRSETLSDVMISGSSVKSYISSSLATGTVSREAAG